MQRSVCHGRRTASTWFRLSGCFHLGLSGHTKNSTSYKWENMATRGKVPGIGPQSYLITKNQRTCSSSHLGNPNWHDGSVWLKPPILEKFFDFWLTCRKTTWHSAFVVTGPCWMMKWKLVHLSSLSGSIVSLELDLCQGTKRTMSTNHPGNVLLPSPAWLNSSCRWDHACHEEFKPCDQHNSGSMIVLFLLYSGLTLLVHTSI